jgi:hypothetical protein
MSVLPIGSPLGPKSAVNAAEIQLRRRTSTEKVRWDAQKFQKEHPDRRVHISSSDANLSEGLSTNCARLILHFSLALVPPVHCALQERRSRPIPKRNLHSVQIQGGSRTMARGGVVLRLSYGRALHVSLRALRRHLNEDHLSESRSSIYTG